LNNIHFIIGSDILIELHKWKSWKKIVKIVKLIVFSRKGYDKNIKNSTVVKYLKNKNIIYIKNKTINISSTILRNKLKKIS
jgi:nicotinate-nucleotide adenylyltransferase